MPRASSIHFSRLASEIPTPIRGLHERPGGELLPLEDRLALCVRGHAGLGEHLRRIEAAHGDLGALLDVGDGVEKAAFRAGICERG